MEIFSPSVTCFTEASQAECYIVLSVQRCIIILSCKARVTVTACFVNDVIKELESINHLCIINTQVIYRFASAQVECTSLRFT